MRVDRDDDQRLLAMVALGEGALEDIQRFGSALGLSPAARTHLGVSVRARTPEDDLADRLLSH